MQENNKDISFLVKIFQLRLGLGNKGEVLGGFSTSLTPKGSQGIVEIPSNSSKSKAAKQTQDQVHQIYTSLALKVDSSPTF